MNKQEQFILILVRAFFPFGPKKNHLRTIKKIIEDKQTSDPIREKLKSFLQEDLELSMFISVDENKQWKLKRPYIPEFMGLNKEKIFKPTGKLYDPTKKKCLFIFGYWELEYDLENNSFLLDGKREITQISGLIEIKTEVQLTDSKLVSLMAP